MALVKKQPSRKRTLIFASILAVCAAAGMYYLLQNTAVPDQSPQDDPALQALDQRVREVKSVDEEIVSDLNRLYRDERFLEMRQFGSLPVEVGPKGRSNPFLPL